MIILAIIATVVIGFLGATLGYDLMKIPLPELGSILAIATMGGFIMAEIRKNNNRK